MDLHSRRTRRIALAVFVVAALSSVLFGLRSFGAFRLLRSAYEAGAPATSSIRPWMTCGIGTDLQAATDFLKNLSGLLLSLTALSASAWIALGRGRALGA